MNTEIEKKVKRFVELSMIFSLSEEQIFSEKEIRTPEAPYYVNTGCMSISLSGLNSTCSCLKQSSETPLTRGQRIFNEGSKRSKLSDDFDEYIELRKTLSEYFESFTKLTQ